MNGYTKLFESILASTLWTQGDKETRLVWITMLAMKGKEHIVEASIPGMAKMAGVTIAECEHALDCLMAPDKYSRTRTEDGRRIKEVDGGWLVINGALYRERMSATDKTEYNRVWMANDRAEKRKNKNESRDTYNGPLPGEREYMDAVRNGESEKQLDDRVTNSLPQRNQTNTPEPHGPDDEGPL